MTAAQAPESTTRWRSAFPFLGSLLSAALLLSNCGNHHENPVQPSPRIRIVNVSTPYSDPLWTPDGQRIFFNHAPLIRIYELQPGSNGLYRDFYYEFAESLAGVWVADMDGGNMHRVLGEGLGKPDLSADGRYVFYEKQGQLWRLAVLGDSLDPASATQVTNAPEGAYGPSISKDGNRILFYTPSGSSAGVHLWNIATGSGRHVGGVGWIWPDWIPNDSGFAFVGGNPPPPWIGLVDTFGVGAFHLREDAKTPQWSPDGRHVAFLARNGATGTPKLWIMNGDGSGARQLTDEGVLERLSWSPDGREIAYVRFSAVDTSYSNGTIWIVDTVTAAKRQVTFNPSP